MARRVFSRVISTSPIVSARGFSCSSVMICLNLPSVERTSNSNSYNSSERKNLPISINSCPLILGNVPGESGH
jgi:hypothetical protein